MPVNSVHTNNAPAAIGAYSQATLAEGFLFTSGQLGIVPATGELANGVEAQARQAFANLEAVCEARRSPPPSSSRSFLPTSTNSPLSTR